MRYTAWLWERIDEESHLGRFAKICYDDVNNGCASARFSATDWISHFEQVHRENRSELSSRFYSAFIEYNKYRQTI